MALLSFLNAGWLSDLFDSTPTPPVYIPIDLSKKGNVAEMVIRSDDSEVTRYFSLIFATRIDGKYELGIDHWIYRFLKIFDGNSIEGTKTPVRLTIYRLEKEKEPVLLLDKTIEAVERNGGIGILNGQKGSYWRRYIYSKELSQGYYRIKLENLQDFPELKDIDIFFGVHFGRGKV